MLKFCVLDQDCETILDQAISRFALSARAIEKVKKTARTIADLNKHENIVAADLLEALSYRRRTTL